MTFDAGTCMMCSEPFDENNGRQEDEADGVVEFCHECTLYSFVTVGIPRNEWPDWLLIWAEKKEEPREV